MATSSPTQAGGSVRKKARRWTDEEHQRLEQLVQQARPRFRWTDIAVALNTGRNGKQVREHYLNARPDSKKGNWTFEEEQKFAKLHTRLGPAWSRIARHLENRTETDTKNHFNSLMRCKTIDFRTTSFLAVYVRLLREGAEACTSTYEEALRQYHHINGSRSPSPSPAPYPSPSQTLTITPTPECEESEGEGLLHAAVAEIVQRQVEQASMCQQALVPSMQHNQNAVVQQVCTQESEPRQQPEASQLAAVQQQGSLQLSVQQAVVQQAGMQQVAVQQLPSSQAEQQAMQQLLAAKEPSAPIPQHLQTLQQRDLQALQGVMMQALPCETAAMQPALPPTCSGRMGPVVPAIVVCGTHITALPVCEAPSTPGSWTHEEEAVLARLHAELGPAWSWISNRLKGRTPEDIEQHWEHAFEMAASDCHPSGSLLSTYARLLRDGAAACPSTYKQAARNCKMHAAKSQASPRIPPMPAASLSSQGTAGLHSELPCTQLPCCEKLHTERPCAEMPCTPFVSGKPAGTTASNPPRAPSLTGHTLATAGHTFAMQGRVSFVVQHPAGSVNQAEASGCSQDLEQAMLLARKNSFARMNSNSSSSSGSAGSSASPHSNSPHTSLGLAPTNSSAPNSTLVHTTSENVGTMYEHMISADIACFDKPVTQPCKYTDCTASPFACASNAALQPAGSGATHAQSPASGFNQQCNSSCYSTESLAGSHLGRAASTAVPHTLLANWSTSAVQASRQASAWPASPESGFTLQTEGHDIRAQVALQQRPSWCSDEATHGAYAPPAKRSFSLMELDDGPAACDYATQQCVGMYAREGRCVRSRPSMADSPMAATSDCQLGSSSTVPSQFKASFPSPCPTMYHVPYPGHHAGSAPRSQPQPRPEPCGMPLTVSPAAAANFPMHSPAVHMYSLTDSMGHTPVGPLCVLPLNTIYENSRHEEATTWASVCTESPQLAPRSDTPCELQALFDSLRAGLMDQIAAT